MTQSAYNYSIKLLSKRDYSTFKLSKKLIQKNYEEDEIEDTIQKLIDLKYIREDEYRRSLIISLLRRSFESNYIIQKLYQEKLYTNDDEINEIKSEIGHDTNEQITKLIDYKIKCSKTPENEEDKFKLKTKIITFLASKGYEFESINHIVNKKIRYEDQY